MTVGLEESSYDYVFKLVVVGNSGVGKINLLGIFVHDTFDFASKSKVGAPLVYDTTKRDLFDNLSRWLNELHINEAHPDSLIMLVGNKSDLESQRTVTQEEAMFYAKDNGLLFMETSALERINVGIAFNSLIHNIFDKLSGKLATMDDKNVEIMKGQAIQISKPLDSNTRNKHSNSCAC